MSSDNTIIMLHTREQNKAYLFDEDGKPYGWQNMFDSPIDTWRVAHVQGFDNFSWYEDNKPYMVGHYLVTEFEKSPIFYDRSEAKIYAQKLHDDRAYVEYGISEIDATKYDLS